MSCDRHRLPADPAEWPARASCRSGHRNIYWSARLQRYAIEIKLNGARIVRYAESLARAIAIARELRREVFAARPIRRAPRSADQGAARVASTRGEAL